MILPVHARVREAVRSAISGAFGLDTAEIPPIAIESPPNRALGDLGVPIAFELARRLRRAPRAIAQDIVAALPPLPDVRRAAAAPNGYVNFSLERAALLRSWLTARAGEETPPPAAGKTIVEHTAINPNKAAHIGHLRNAALGDTLGRMLRFRGDPVEIQNYIDDTGVQVADVVVGFRCLERADLDEVRVLGERPRFDYYCWDLYARVTQWYDQDKAHLQHRVEALHDIEHGVSPSAEMAAYIADRMVRRHLETMARLNIDYELLTWEGDILRLQFWARAFELLKASGAVFLQTDGRLASCWVMRIEDDPVAHEGSGREAAAEDDAEDLEPEAREKVIVRSNGTVTYVGKDIAYQFWKFGVLGRDFHYRPFGRRRDGSVLWATSTTPSVSGSPTPPSFGGAARTYNVIDTRQSYLQKLLRQALVAAGHPEAAERSIHYSYEMVALSHATARELGYAPDQDASRPFVEVSGRKGLGVKADDLLDRLADKATAEVTARNPELPESERLRIGTMIATAAVRYFMIKYSRGKVIAFDIEEALSFEGETGPYLQYALVRANNIFGKLAERDGTSEAAILEALATTPATVLEEGNEGDELWDLVLAAARLDDVVEQAIRTLELSVLAKYAFGLAQAFNAFYHRYPILNEPRGDVQVWRAAVAAYFRRQLSRAVDLMGIEAPVRM